MDGAVLLLARVNRRHNIRLGAVRANAAICLGLLLLTQLCPRKRDSRLSCHICAKGREIREIGLGWINKERRRYHAQQIEIFLLAPEILFKPRKVSLQQIL